MHHDILNTRKWFFSQFEIKNNIPRSVVATSPKRSHLLHLPLGSLHADYPFPFDDKRE